MNEQEYSQRVIDILASRMDDIFVGEYYVIRTDKIIEVAKEITAISKQPQKDTRSRRERVLDAKFERIGVKPMLYHFTKNVYPFSVITIAHTIWTKTVLRHMLDDIFIQNSLWIPGCSPATQMFRKLASKKVYGVAICYKHDQYNKKHGRNKAKGRLWQHLLTEQQK